jgi:hypothetical protein
MTASFDLPVDLVDAIALRFTSGALGVLGSTGGLRPGQDEVLEYRLLGRDGHVAFDVLAGRAAIHDADGIEELPALSGYDLYPEAGPADNLVDVVLGRGANMSPGTIGAATVDVVAAMYRSSATGTAVAIAPGA